jgi:hypothetical protein
MVPKIPKSEHTMENVLAVIIFLLNILQKGLKT